MHPFGGVAGIRPRPLGGLVVRVGVDLEEAEPIVGHCLCNLTGWRRSPDGDQLALARLLVVDETKPHSSASRAWPSSGPLAMRASPATSCTRPRGR